MPPGLRRANLGRARTRPLLAGAVLRPVRELAASCPPSKTFSRAPSHLGRRSEGGGGRWMGRLGVICSLVVTAARWVLVWPGVLRLVLIIEYVEGGGGGQKGSSPPSPKSLSEEPLVLSEEPFGAAEDLLAAA
eukprot:5835496-Pyramimonas_sp.AAC.1